VYIIKYLSLHFAKITLSSDSEAIGKVKNKRCIFGDFSRDTVGFREEPADAICSAAVGVRQKSGKRPDVSKWVLKVGTPVFRVEGFV
jgi:hypothetical protein